MSPNNVRTVRLTAAAGTNLARASSRDWSSPCGPSSPSTALYNPKAFIAHAASLGQACAHCRRSSTAASRRSLASVTVPVARVVLSHPLGILALVSRYLTNKLIPHEPLPGRNSFRIQRMPPNTAPGITLPLGRLSQSPGQVTHALLPLSPLPPQSYPQGIRSTCMPNPRRQRSF